MIIDISKIKNILFCCHEGALGDAIIDSFVFREIHKKFPNIKIYMVAHGAYYGYYSINKNITLTYKLPIKKRLRFNQRWLELFFYALYLRKYNFDLICDFSNSTRLNWRMFKSIIRKDGVIYDYFNNNGNFGSFDIKRSDHIKAIMLDIGLNNIDTHYDMYSTKSAESKLDNFKSTYSIKDYICINSFGNTDIRTFNSETINFLLSNLNKHQVVIPCMPEKLDYLDFLANNKNSNVYIYETKNIFELISLIKSCDICISPDTSAIHIASGYNKPILAFYNNYRKFYAPKCDKYKIIKTDKNNVNFFDKNNVTKELAEFIAI